jgi:hypothetical protein
MCMLKKVYGKDVGTEVYQALQDVPAAAVPVVLTSLKQKNNEWRRAQHEWSHTWRQVDAPKFYTSPSTTWASTSNRMTSKRSRLGHSSQRSRVCVRSNSDNKHTKRVAHAQDLRACVAHLVSSLCSHSRTWVSCTTHSNSCTCISATIRQRTACWSAGVSSASSEGSCPYCATFNATCGPLEIGVEKDSGDEQQIDEGPARTHATAGGGGGGGSYGAELGVEGGSSEVAE